MVVSAVQKRRKKTRKRRKKKRRKKKKEELDAFCVSARGSFFVLRAMVWFLTVVIYLHCFSNVVKFLVTVIYYENEIQKASEAS